MAYACRPGTYTKIAERNCYGGHGGVDIDSAGEHTLSVAACEARCDADMQCTCVTYSAHTGWCWKRSHCVPAQFEPDTKYDVYMRAAIAKLT